MSYINNLPSQFLIRQLSNKVINKEISNKSGIDEYIPPSVPISSDDNKPAKYSYVEIEKYLSKYEKTEIRFNTNVGSTDNSTADSDGINSNSGVTSEQFDINSLFRGRKKITASMLSNELESMLNSNDPGIKKLAYMIKDTFQKLGIGNRRDIQKFVIQEIFSQINIAAKNTVEGFGIYDISQDSLEKLSKSGDLFSTLEAILNSEELKNKVNNGFDSSVGDFAQNGDGACWLFAGLKALNATSTGRELIKSSIQWASDLSNVTIKFQGVSKSYTISLDSLIDNRMKYAFGDIEAVAFAMATEMLRRDIKNNIVQVDSHRDFNHINTEDDGKPGNGIYGGNTDQFFYFLTGKAEYQGNEKLDPKVVGQEYLRHLLEDGFNHYSSIFTLSGENLYRFYKNHNVNNLSESELQQLKNSGHTFAITGISENSVIISDPATTTLISISWAEFCNAGIDYISELYMHGKQIQN